MTLTFTIDDLVKTVRMIAEKHPDRTYDRAGPHESCFYHPTPENPYGCVMGAALAELGIETTSPTFLPLEGKSIGWVLEQLLGEPQEVPGRYWLDRVQSQQDAGATWREAVAYADSFV